MFFDQQAEALGEIFICFFAHNKPLNVKIGKGIKNEDIKHHTYENTRQKREKPETV